MNCNFSPTQLQHLIMIASVFIHGKCIMHATSVNCIFPILVKPVLSSSDALINSCIHLAVCSHLYPWYGTDLLRARQAYTHHSCHQNTIHAGTSFTGSTPAYGIAIILDQYPVFHLIYAKWSLFRKRSFISNSMHLAMHAAIYTDHSYCTRFLSSFLPHIIYIVQAFLHIILLHFLSMPPCLKCATTEKDSIPCDLWKICQRRLIGNPNIYTNSP